MTSERESPFSFAYSLRCRLGAWLLKPHIVALCEHYNNASTIRRIKGQEQERRTCESIGIGLRYALGLNTEWRRLNDRTNRMVRDAREGLEHARDAL